MSETKQPSSRKPLIIVALLALIVLAGVVIVWQLRQEEPTHAVLQHVGLPRLFQAPEFAFTDQTGRRFSQAELHDKIWICDFIFTRCAGTCPKMTGAMVDLQKKITSGNVHFVSFSVDPDRDDTASLAAYVKKYNADEPRWHFLTASDKASIFKFAVGMKIADPLKGDDPVMHAEQFLLIDQTGRVRGIYNSKDSVRTTQLVRDAQSLLP